MQVYSLAWSSDFIISTFLLFLSTIVLSPIFRDFCFHASTRQDSPGIAATQTQAMQWAQSIQDMFTSAGDGGEKVSEMVSEEINGVIVRDMKMKKEIDGGDEHLEKKDIAVEFYGKPAMRIIGGLADKYERIAK